LDSSSLCLPGARIPESLRLGFCNLFDWYSNPQFYKNKKTGVSAVTAIGIVVAIYISVTAVSAISIGHSYFLIEIMTLDLSQRR
jgi:hypothetical protein